MDRGIFISMSGAKATLSKQDRIAQNIANANTPGYKAVVSQTIPAHINSDTRNSRAFAVEVSERSIKNDGMLIQTDNPLNVALSGNAWFVVNDGKKDLLTRNGSFLVSAEGILTTTSGFPVVSDNGVVSVPEQSTIGISSNGDVFVSGQDGKETLIDRLKIVSSDNPVRLQNGLFFSEVTETIDYPKLVSGYLESSNVNTSSELIDMISSSRLFEMQMKAIQMFKENDESANKVMAL